MRNNRDNKHNPKQTNRIKLHKQNHTSFLWLELLLFYCLNLEALMLIDCIQGQPGFSLISSTL